MKWISPAWISSACALALLPAATVTGQSTSSPADKLAPGPIAELLPGLEPSPSFRLGTINPTKTIVQPLGKNLLPGEDFAPPNPLPSGSGSRGSGTFTTTPPRGSLINEPVPSNQVLRNQQNIYSDTFTLPRTPVASQPNLQQQPPAPNSTDRDQHCLPTVAKTADTGGICACGSNALAPENCQCNGCQGHQTHADFSDECSTSDSCKPANEAVECGTCGDSVCNNCEIIGGPGSYFNTQANRLADDQSHPNVGYGPVVRHFKKHKQKKQPLRQHDCPNRSDQGYGGCDNPNCDGTSCNHGYCDSGRYYSRQYDARQNDDDVYQPAVVDTRNPDDTQTNTLFNVSGVYFRRNTPDLLLSSQRGALGATPHQFLTTDDANHGDFGGFDASIIRRRATGKGFELRYLNLTPSEATATLGGNPITLVNQFGQIGHMSGITHQQAFDLAHIHEVTRDSSIQNAEFNLLRMGRQAHTRRGQQATSEYLLGFRYFKFEETLSYSGLGIRPNGFVGGDITRADYVSEVENELFGAQFGGRSEINLFNRMSLLIGLKAGIFQNNVSSRQRASTLGIPGDERIAQVLNNPNQGALYDLSGEADDYTLLGEIDLGLTFRITKSIRLRGGYKALFVDDIAFADDQIGFDFNNIQFNSIPRANDDLVLHGGYFGIDFAF